MSIPIALQLYSLRDDCKDNILGVIEKVAKMGYDGVEFAGYHGASSADLFKVLGDTGLKVEGCHAGLATLDDENFLATVDFHAEIGCHWLIIPWLPEEKRNSEDACRQTAEELTKLVEKLRPFGMKTGFHAHDSDMKPLAGGRPAYDLIAEGTPEDFIMQYDTCNGMAGGADPVQPILSWPGRNASTHLKEFSDPYGSKAIGEGLIPWNDVFAACENGGGTEWYVVEHEVYIDTTPLEIVEKCLKNLRAMGK